MSFFNTKSLKEEISRLDKLEKSNKLRLQKIQSNSKIKLNRDQYLRYKEILFNHSLEKRGKVREENEDDKENENKNYINLPKKVYSSYDHELPAKEISKKEYEYPFQKVSVGTSMPICQEISVQTENEEIWRKEYIGKGSGKKEQRVENEENENIIILDEMNPNLSFSSCPLSDIKTHPSKESLNELKTHKEIFREENLDSNRRTLAKEYEVEKNGYEENIFMEEEIIQENTNIYKKTFSEKTKRKIQNVDSDQKRKDPEDEVIDYEFQLLMEQRKALENELEELKKLQDITRKGSPFKKKEEKQIRNDFKEEMTIQRPDFNTRVPFSDRSEEHQENFEFLDMDLRRNSPTNRIDNNFEWEKKNERKDKTRRMQEDEWKIGQEFWKTKKKIFNQNVDDITEESVEVPEIKDEKENKLSNERKSLYKELIDSIGSSIEEIKKQKQNGTPEFKKNKNIDIENFSRSKYLSEFGSGNKELGPIIEEENEEAS